MKIDPEIMLRDYPIMLMITGLLLAFCLWQVRGKTESMITRNHGVILLGIYLVYQITIVYQSLHMPLVVV
jgi:Ca2+/Na+ antiporter